MWRLGWLLAVVATVSPPLDDIFDASMSRHMLLQMPLLAILGHVAGKLWPRTRLQVTSHAVSAVVFAIGSMLFWMLPRSLDMAVTQARVDQLMHANMLLVGWLLAAGVPRLEFQIKMAFGVYGLAMLLAAGAIFASTVVPVCSAYTVKQQNRAGELLLWAGAMLFVALLIRGASLLRMTGSEQRNSLYDGAFIR